MERIFVDTGGWAALFGDNDGNHKSAVTVYERLKKSKAALYTSDYVIDETITLTMVRSNHTQSVLVGKALLESTVVKAVPVAPDYIQPSWELYQKYNDKHFSFTDITTLVIAKSLNIKKFFSYDREFEKVGMELLS